MDAIKPLTIMIADDDEDDRELLKFLFNQNEKFELVGCYESGVEALKEIMVKKNVPQILLIDMYMPMLNGTEVLKKLEDAEVARETVKFIISTSINITEQGKYANNPSVKFLKKPTTLVEINDLPGDILEALYLHNHMKI